jgi:hypothetical protein
MNNLASPFLPFSRWILTGLLPCLWSIGWARALSWEQPEDCVEGTVVLHGSSEKMAASAASQSCRRPVIFD